MKLVIDQGNSFVKIAFFKGKTLIKKEIFSDIKQVEPLLDTCQSIIFSSVFQSTLPAFLQHAKSVIHFSNQTSLPISHVYKSPQTLGVDRLAAVVGATVLFPNQNVLTIDAGTCITYDFINDKACYLGGSISPGVQIRYKSLHHFTAKLPLLSTAKKPELIGEDTQKAIHSGVINGLIGEIDGIIDRYKNSYHDLKVLLTGGDVNIFDKELKNSIFASPDLVLIGLNEILDYNETIV